MDIPEAWMQRLFSRLRAIYGNRMATMWGDCPEADVMDAWQDGLRFKTGDAIRKGLEQVATAYPEWPPTLGEFLGLCKNAPAMHRELEAPSVSWDAPDPKVLAAIAELTDKSRKRDPRDWARTILKDHAAGTYTLPIGVEYAKEALGIAVE